MNCICTTGEFSCRQGRDCPHRPVYTTDEMGWQYWALYAFTIALLMAVVLLPFYFKAL